MAISVLKSFAELWKRRSNLVTKMNYHDYVTLFDFA
jgi:hypothetical protein